MEVVDKIRRKVYEMAIIGPLGPPNSTCAERIRRDKNFIAEVETDRLRHECDVLRREVAALKNVSQQCRNDIVGPLGTLICTSRG